MKRLLSSLLIAVMLFTTVVAVVPVRADAAYSPSTSTKGEASLTAEQIKQLFTTNKPEEEDDVLGLYAYKFNSAREMLDYEISMGYISSKTYGNYTLCVNSYTGYIYYINNITGQIITSNPYDSGYLNKDPGVGDGNRITSQLVIKFLRTSDSAPFTYASSLWAGARSQISTTPIKNGFRVNYTLGDTSARALLPVQITADRFEQAILIPLLEAYRDALKLNDSSLTDEEADFFANEEYEYDGEVQPIKMCSGYINIESVKGYLQSTKAYFKRGDAHFSTLNELNIFFNQFFGENTYNLKDPVSIIKDYNDNIASGKPNDNTIIKLKNMFELNPLTGRWDGDPDNGGTPVPGIAIYALGNPEYETQRQDKAREFSEKIVKYTDYTHSDLYSDENEVGIKVSATSKPVFRCALEYVINDDGTLTVTLPVSSLSFDESLYTLEEIVSLEYFGCGNYKEFDTYAFFPDGSGMITDFNDHTNANHTRTLYGTDYAYSKLEKSFEYLEQVTMPVYGMVSETPSNVTPGKTVRNGYFAIVEEGSALAKLGMFSGGSTSKYANTYLSYAPNPSDTFDLTETISVGNITSYTLTLESKYVGSYVTNITMLTDPDVAKELALTEYYESSYVGMAARYRDYLVGNGTLSAIQNIEERMPLYIETLGSLEIIKKYLTFPVNVNIPLTTFDNVMTMYNELAAAKQTLINMANEYRKLADETPKDDPDQKEFYLKKAKEYEELEKTVVNMTNVNFKLTGFANDGMDYTYPTKVKWEKACGGKSGFRDLVAEAKIISAKTNEHLGIYPEFDFMFLMNEETFDGVNRWDKSRMIDNRYASKQIYNPANRMYDKGFGSIISTASLSELFSKFEKRYSKYDWKYLSLSTFGSTLNSNFDEDNPVNRVSSLDYVTEVLDGARDKGYDIMVDKGNSYTYEYASHILDISIDSSHHAYCTNTVPFIGMVLHGYINYTGGAINYSGSIDYDILRSIENGASLYYLLCYQNTNYMKDKMVVSKYYSVNYATWFERIASAYTKLDAAIGKLQGYQIVDHKTIIAEKYLTPEVVAENVNKITEEFISLLDKEIRAAVNAKILEVGQNPDIKLTVDADALVAQFVKVTSVPAEYAGDGLKTLINERASYWSKHFGTSENGTNEVIIRTVKDADTINDLKSAFIEAIKTELSAALDAKKEVLDAQNQSGEPITDYSFKVSVDIAALVAQLKASMPSAPDYYFDKIFATELYNAVSTVAAEYGATNEGANEVTFSAVQEFTANDSALDYVSAYDYFTTSKATDKDYDKTFYSVANYNVVMVTYRNAETGHEVSFVLNYNIDKVTVDFGNGKVKILGKYAFDFV